MSVPGSGADPSATEAVVHPGSRKKLDELLEELRLCVERDGKQRAAAMRQNLQRAESLLRRVPLAHGMREIEHLLAALQGGALLSRRDLRMPRLPSEAYLGIESCVYTSAGVFYPERRIALVFRATAEENADVNASPWDTGSFCASGDICPRLPLPPHGDRRALFDKTHLPAPLYRDYLVQYVAACFGAPEDYLSRNKHRYGDPAGAMSPHKWQSRVFEVRFHDRVPIAPTTLLAAFVPRNAGDRRSLSLGVQLEKLKANSVDVHIYDNADHLGRTVREWIHKYARQEAAS